MKVNVPVLDSARKIKTSNLPTVLADIVTNGGVGDIDVEVTDALLGEASGVTTAKFGWSGADIPAITNEVFGIWMARDTWERIDQAQWLYVHPTFPAWVTANPGKSVDIGVPLVPHDSVPSSGLNALFDQVIANASVQVHPSGTMKNTDDVYLSLGRSLGQNWTPSNGTCYARIYWEFNMSPDPQQNIDRTKFIGAWNRAIPKIREGFAQTGAGKTLKIVFCPISDGADYAPFYPANANVDVIAQDTYAQKWGTVIPTSADLLAWTNTFLTNLTTFAVSKGKPLGLGEWGNWQTGTAGQTGAHGRGDFPEYIDQVFDWVDAQKNTASPVEYLCYFNLSDAGVGITLNDTPNSLARLQTRVNGTRAGGLLDAKTDKLLSRNAQTGTTYTLALADANKVVETNNAAANTVTVPPNSSVAYPIGTVIEIAQYGAGQTTIAPGAGVTIRTRGNALKLGGQYAVAALRKRAANEWILIGDITV